jgi:serine/threonine protein kinase
MMPDPTACPDTPRLEQFLAGKLNEGEQKALELHIEGCASCQQALESLLPTNRSWIDVLGKPKVRTGDLSEVTQAGPTATALEEELSFLTPSSKPGHLGRLGHYEVLELLGKGGFGTVLRAFDEKLHRVVAIKVLSPELSASGTARKRFTREAQAAAAVAHEHVVTIHAVEDEANPPYLVMQCIEGQSLQDKLDKEGPLGLKEILRIGLQAAEGLAAAHKQGLVHRDIKPANILLENGVERVKITDFGLARAVDDASLTQSGVVAGTPLYMSPEQAEGQNIDHRSDLFSLGTVLYVMCTGRPPFRATGTMAVLKRVIEETPRPIHEINPEIPDWLADLIGKLHAKKPEDRFQHAKEVAQLLAQHLAQVQQPVRLPSPPRGAEGRVRGGTPKPQPGKRVLRRVIAAVLLLALLTGTVIGLYFLLPDRSKLSPGPEGQTNAYNLILIRDNPDIQLFAVPEQGGQHGFIFDGLETRVDLPPGVYQIQGRTRNGVLVFQERVTLEANKPQTVRVYSGWEQLFNGKDLTDWGRAAGDAGKWKVVDGAITCSGPGGDYLYTKRDDFANFHLRAEVKINDVGNSGIYFRAGKPLQEFRDYEAQVTNNPDQHFKTGSLQALVRVAESPVQPDTWFTYEIIANGNNIRLLVNGKETANYTEARPDRRSRGHIALQHYTDVTQVHFRKIEIKELPPTPPTDKEEWVKLFNGKDLTDWGGDAGNWKVLDGAITCSGPSDYLYTNRDDFANFHVRAEVKINDVGNSGIFFRAGKPVELDPDDERKHLAGGPVELDGDYEAQISTHPKIQEKTGSLYGLVPVKDVIVEPNTWFTYEIIARGNRLRLLVNGNETASYEERRPKRLKGHIALQHGNANTSVFFRKIEIKELPPPPPDEKDRWVSLFNGEDLTGWKTHPQQPGNWRVEKRILTGSGPAASHLYTNRGDHTNVHLRVEARINDRGNSGVFVRAPFKAGHPYGYEAQINASNPDVKTGGLYYKSSSGKLQHIHPGDHLTRPGEWFVLEVIATGNHIVIKVNGKTTVDFVDEENCHPTGHIALQQHDAQTVVEFRKIEIKELPPTRAISKEPFVILAKGDRAEQGHATLKDAVEKARSGDTIEVRSDGPFITPHIQIRGKALCIRAGEGCSPRLRLGPIVPDPMIATDSALMLEGIELQRERSNDKPGPCHAISALRGIVWLAHCRISIWGQGCGLDTLPAEARILRCDIRAESGSPLSGPFHKGGRIEVEGSVLTGRSGAADLYQFAPEPQQASVVIRSSTLFSSNLLRWYFNDTLPAMPPGLKEGEKAKFLDVSLEGNVLACSNSALQFQQKNQRLPEESVLAVLRRGLVWKDHRNVYPELKQFVLLAETPIPEAGPIKTLIEWDKLHGTKESDNLQGTFRFLGGDPSKGVMGWRTQDFRLADKSAGQGKGPGGKDLGADVDRVGPGKPYEEWKGTPEYRKWCEKIDKLLKGP